MCQDVMSDDHGQSYTFMYDEVFCLIHRWSIEDRTSSMIAPVCYMLLSGCVCERERMKG